MPPFELFKKAPQKEGKQEQAIETVDMEKVERIVQQMQKKNKKEGINQDESNQRVTDLRGLASGEQKLEVQKIEDLKQSESPLVRMMGGLFLSMNSLFKPIADLMSNFSAAKQLSYYLYSANMKYSLKQWLALTTVAAGIAAIFALIVSFLLIAFLSFPAVILPLFVFAAFFMTLALMFLIPKQKANARGRAVSLELPFALRHIATQLSAGIGLYRTLQTVAAADYGVLSEEFSRTITEIEEGTDTKLALRHLSVRTQSKALRNAL